MPIPGITELAIILAIVFLLFGAKRIPDLAKSLGSGVREFRQGISNESDDTENEEEQVSRRALNQSETHTTVHAEREA